MCIGLGFMAAGCGDTGGDSGSEYDRPQGARAIIGDEDLAKLAEGGFSINDGTNPPDISGSYYDDSLVVSYDDAGAEGMAINNYEYTFGETSSDLELEISYASDGGSDIGDGVGGFISGDGRCFTIYMDGSGTTGCGDYKVAQLISGCVGSSGIEDFQLGVMMIDRPASCDGSLIESGHRRVIDETDGVAERR